MDIIKDIINRARALPLEAFAVRYPGPYLLRARSEEEIRWEVQHLSNLATSRFPSVNAPEEQQAALAELFEPEAVTHRGFQLPQGGQAPAPTLPTEAELPMRFACYAVTKSARSSPAEPGISLGRARSCDIVLPLLSVSKLHAIIRKEGEAFRIYDAESRFGTFVDDQAVDPTAGQALAPGKVVRLGEFPLTFLDAAGLHGWVFEKLASR